MCKNILLQDHYVIFKDFGRSEGGSCVSKATTLFLSIKQFQSTCSFKNVHTIVICVLLLFVLFCGTFYLFADRRGIHLKRVDFMCQNNKKRMNIELNRVQSPFLLV